MMRPMKKTVRALPKEPGTTPIPEGHVRGYHYTRSLEHLDSIRREGLQLGKARGETYGEPNAVWGSATKPDANHAFVEFHFPVAEHKDAIGLPYGNVTQSRLDEFNTGHSNFALGRSIGPEKIVAHSDPVIGHLRYMADEKDTVKEMIKGGELDWMARDKTEPALRKTARTLVPQLGRTSRASRITR